VRAVVKLDAEIPAHTFPKVGQGVVVDEVDLVVGTPARNASTVVGR